MSIAEYESVNKNIQLSLPITTLLRLISSGSYEMWTWHSFDLRCMLKWCIVKNSLKAVRDGLAK